MKTIEGIVHLAATDLANHVSCGHLTTLDLKLAHGEIGGYTNFDPLLEILAERGRAHEDAYVEYLRATARRVEDAQGLSSPVDLMRAGVDVITQARLSSGTWGGRTDFLVRVERPCTHWPWSYEVIDTKLATNTRAGAVLQLCVYSDLLAALQGIAPDWMHIVRPGPDFPRDSYRFDEYAAYYRLLRRDLEARVATSVDTYPDPTPHCDSCNWRSRCDAQRRADDHLSLVADLSRLHQRELERVGIRTLAELAGAPTPWPFTPERGAAATYERLEHQARLQLAARSVTVPPVELLPLEPERGLARLPVPSPGDVFLDLEGDPFIGDAGREYLFGWFTDDRGYEHIWAIDDAAERAAFERLIDTIMARWAADPGLHIYHFAAYETTAFKRLAGGYATRADELDRLLRGRRFIDLHSVTRQALRAGVESYSIKRLEPIIDFTREIALDDAGTSHRGLRLALQRGMPEAIEPAWRPDVEAYNRDDCISAARLRDWLEARRAELVFGGAVIGRPPLRDGEPEQVTAVRTAAAETAVLLLAGIPDDRKARTDVQHATWLLGHLMQWYVREGKVAWWDFFRLAGLSDDERLDDAKAIAGLRHLERRTPRRRNPIDCYSFPAQEVLLRKDEVLYIDAEVKVGTVLAIDLEAQTIEIVRTIATLDQPLTSVFVRKIVGPKPKDGALVQLGQAVVACGFLPATQPSLARDLLLRNPPRGLATCGGDLSLSGEPADECAVRLALALDGTVLPIQGPPGSGKTETAARMIVSLVQAGRRVGITATSHAVIENLAKRVADVAAAQGLAPHIVLKSEPPGEGKHPGIEYTNDPADAEARMPELDLLGATAWQWARDGMRNTVDVLFIDEAGQMSLADALAVSAAARSLVLVGDPQQLEQPIQGTHPDGVGVSVLQHILGGAETIAPDRGLFLDRTHRLHPSICAFTSEQFYERRLLTGPEVEQQSIAAAGIDHPGLYWVPVEHEGNQNHSAEEAAAIADLVAHCLMPGARWTNASGAISALTASNVLIVAPYNAHVAAIRAALTARGLGGVPVGTVDRFQGQQAAIAIYSMATSNPADAPRGLAFLYDRHRLNVATSRARCASVVVASPALLRPDCTTPRHLHLASALARFVELARGTPPRALASRIVRRTAA